ncbi:MAG: SCO family protein [Chthoniobacterales bacterium]
MSDGPKRIPRLGWAIAFVAAVTMIGVTFVSFKTTKPNADPMPAIAEVPAFSFTSQSGETMTREDLAGDVWIANFIFTRCPGPCPVMSSRMQELQAAIEGKGGGVRLVSVTVDPEHDTPEVLREYSERYGADPEVWKFLTGDPEEVTDFVQKGMLQPLAKGDDDLPVHSQRFLVVDAEGQIRAFHDLNDPALIPELLMDIGGLMRERGQRK